MRRRFADPLDAPVERLPGAVRLRSACGACTSSPGCRARVIDVVLTGERPEVSVRAFPTGRGSLPALEERPPVDTARAGTPPRLR
ncbi:hypothetical protein HZZ00_30660 [Streptomyces sp. NEAU-sy36]|uniref:hypothetical protein n=1 Tax=unclassified Streptomyces TaxID=2593676 RepID=UPI0015D5B1DB|nr:MULTISPECIES: hypothetical protein [unclassified Streptomyces]QLJ04953.1 hypothetical protein HZZ00_30660 [Streptomyces sp. NEAU-sy36]